MIRGAKVGDVVEVRPMRSKRLDGTVVDTNNATSPPLRCVATVEGHHWVSPDEMWPTDAEDATRPVQGLREGERVVLPYGVVRAIERIDVRQQVIMLHLAADPLFPHHWRTLTVPRTARLRVVSPESADTA